MHSGPFLAFCKMFFFCVNIFASANNKNYYYDVTVRPFVESPFLNYKKNFSIDATIFYYESTVGLIFKNADGEFILISMKLENQTYIPAQIDCENIIPLRDNQDVEIYYPDVTQFDDDYYLLYMERNKTFSKHALATTKTPLNSSSWSKIGYLSYPVTNIVYIAPATILWKTNDTKYNYYYFAFKDDDGSYDEICRTYPVNGYVILEETDPTKFIQRSVDPIVKEEEITGLIKNPNGCPLDATKELDPELADNIECFLGVFNNITTKLNADSTYGIGFLYLFVNWRPPTTSAPFQSTKPSSSTTAKTDTTLEANESTSSKNINTSPKTSIDTTTSTSTKAYVNTTIGENLKPSSFKIYAIIGSTIILLIIFVIILFLVFRHKKNRERKSWITDLMKQQQLTREAAKALVKTVDQFEIHSRHITILFNEKLGSGATATVYKGFLNGNSTFATKTNKSSSLKNIYSNCEVAIKIPKDMNQQETEQITIELRAMQKIGFHPNISTLFGWCLQNNIVSLVFELAQQDLYTYVHSFQNSQNEISPCLPLKEHLSIAWQITIGMQHLANYKIIHRDLAARNILLFDNLHVKISDFGLSIFCDETFTYESTHHKKLPIRWLSIEALIDKQFSEKSDVWAFGILLYEMSSNGAIPYSLISTEEIIEFLKNGERLQKPENLKSDEIYDLMSDCWMESVLERPSFDEIRLRLAKQMKEGTETYGYLTLKNNEENKNVCV